MQNKIVPIVVQKEGVSDSTYKIIELSAPNKSAVKEGDIIFCLETSKVAIDVTAPTSGFLFYNDIISTEVTIGETIAVIAEDKNFNYKNWFQTLNTSKKEDLSKNNIKVSNPAQRLIDENNINLSVFENYTLVTKQDVEEYLQSFTSNIDQNNLVIDNKSIVIFGGGGHAKMCIDLIKQTKTHNIIGILDDNQMIAKTILDIPVIGNTKSVEKLVEKGLKNIILGIGGVFTKELKNKMFQSLQELKLKIPTIIHPSSNIEPSVKMGIGNQIMQGAIIGSNVQIGNNCIINSGSIVSHDTIIEDNVHIAPGAIIAGGVTIKKNTIIGMGSTIFLGLTIGENVIIQNGVNIFKNVDNNSRIK